MEVVQTRQLGQVQSKKPSLAQAPEILRQNPALPVPRYVQLSRIPGDMPYERLKKRRSFLT
jgi:hypothetical protein